MCYEKLFASYTPTENPCHNRRAKCTCGNRTIRVCTCWLYASLRKVTRRRSGSHFRQKLISLVATAATKYVCWTPHLNCCASSAQLLLEVPRQDLVHFCLSGERHKMKQYSTDRFLLFSEQENFIQDTTEALRNGQFPAHTFYEMVFSYEFALFPRYFSIFSLLMASLL